jgi:hypothetical protein
MHPNHPINRSVPANKLLDKQTNGNKGTRNFTARQGIYTIILNDPEAQVPRQNSVFGITSSSRVITKVYCHNFQTQTGMRISLSSWTLRCILKLLKLLTLSMTIQSQESVTSKCHHSLSHPGFGHLLSFISAIFEHNSTLLIRSCNELDNHVFTEQAGEIHLKLVEVDG